MGLRQASQLSAEDLVRIGGADIMLDGVVRGASQGGATTDCMLVAILPFGVLGILATWGGSRLLRRGRGGCRSSSAYVFQLLLCTRYRKLDSRRPLLKAPKAARSSLSGQREYSWLNLAAYSRRGSSSPCLSMYRSSAE
ncbi:unnamed protein product [Prunus brigantina]